MRLLTSEKFRGSWDVALIFSITLGEVLCTALGLHGLYRDVLAVAFVLYCPGAAILMRVQLHRGNEGFTYSICLSIALGIFGSSISYYAEIANQIHLLYLEAGLVFVLLAWELYSRLSGPETTADSAETEPAS
jgi:hypothetical protein